MFSIITRAKSGVDRKTFVESKGAFTGTRQATSDNFLSHLLCFYCLAISRQPSTFAYIIIFVALKNRKMLNLL